MPYINDQGKDALRKGEDMVGPGDLNYLITKMLLRYLEQKGSSYQTINDVVGALEGAKMEFYRRVAAPYEDKKIKENGDVY